MTIAPVPISFTLDAPMFKRLEERAKSQGRRAVEYIKLLVEAAYLARCAAEKGEATDDAELDRQVRNVFLLADCEPDFIADALALPAERVKQILTGWKIAAKNGFPAARQAEPAQAPATTTKPAPPPAQQPKNREPKPAWPPEMVATMQKMWAAGAKGKEIAAAIGKKEGNVSVFMSNRRDLFPRRVEKR